MGNKKEYALKVKHVGIKFNLKGDKADSLKEYVIDLLLRKKHKPEEEFWGLKDISFTVKPGDRVGVLGLNGAGKSTLLKVIAGVYRPTEGKVLKNGKIAPLLELGAGFEREYTAKENIYLYGAELGYTKKFIDEKFDEIVEFSELQEFMDVPIKNYSSGMRARLGFAMCTAVCPEILILDEVLSVGDAKFRKKSEKKIMDMFDTGVTVLFVSHSLEQVKRICNKAMILDHGELISYGNIDRVADEYQQILEDHWGETLEARRARRRKKRLEKQARADERLRKLEERKKKDAETRDERTV
jgi:ABC-2 type transport system ATP-binding protein